MTFFHARLARYVFLPPRRLVRAAGGMLFGLCGFGVGVVPQEAMGQESPKPTAAVAPLAQGARSELRVEFFGAERGFAVGRENVSVLCVLRNVGTATLPANSVQLYCYPMVGLDYTTGEIKPLVPELAPNQATAFRWQLAPGSAQGTLLTAVMLQNVTSGGTGAVAVGASAPPPPPNAALPPVAGLPRAIVAAIPHFVAAPALGSIRAGTVAGPVAVAHSGEVWLANDRVSLHLRRANGAEPVLSLAAKDGTEWRVLATANPVVELLSCEDGQKPWWQRFNWRSASARSGRDDGSITLGGSAGRLWETEWSATVRRDTGVVEGRIRLTARQNVRLFGVRLPRLLVQTDAPGGGLGRADGKAIALPLDEPAVSDAPRLAAAHRGGVTFGLAWPSRPPLDGWNQEMVPAGEAHLVPLLTGGWLAPERGDLVLAGASIDIPFRLFAFAPSGTIHDAGAIRPALKATIAMSTVPHSRTVRAFAKINLTLDVFSKRADGYHSLASVMQAISLHDTLTLTRREEPGIGFTCDLPVGVDVPADATNLAYRAAQAVLDAAAQSGKAMEGGVSLHLTKRIPAQAGLGGGSSDAAAALVGVDALFGLELSRETLHDCAAALGSDVPFFLIGGTAVARGRGENLTALPDAPSAWLVIVKPEENVSTGWAYNQLDAVPDRASHRATKRLEEALRADDRERLLAFQSNDFELPVFTHFPKLAWLHDELRMAGALTAHLCGSGSALYAVAPDSQTAQRIAAKFTGRYPHVTTARTLSRIQSDPLGENPL